MPVLREYRFLIPIRGDAGLSDGGRHPPRRWNLLIREMRRRFGAFTLAPGLYEGEYTDPDTRKPVRDESRMYVVALPDDRADELREMLAVAAAVFFQKCIYMAAGDGVEFITAVDGDDERLSRFGR